MCILCLISMDKKYRTIYSLKINFFISLKHGLLSSHFEHTATYLSNTSFNSVNYDWQLYNIRWKNKQNKQRNADKSFFRHLSFLDKILLQIFYLEYLKSIIYITIIIHLKILLHGVLKNLLRCWPCYKFNHLQ